jgi:hypothetical protein
VEMMFLGNTEHSRFPPCNSNKWRRNAT